MGAQETSSIAVCATGPSELEALVQAVRAAGTWGIVPIEWPDPPGLALAQEMAHAFVLRSAPGKACEKLAGALQRRGTRPLIVIGEEPMPQASPNVWLPALPATPLLGRLISELIDGQQETSGGPAWRRKTDMIIGDSPAIRQLLSTLDHLAPAQTPVMISGESGVGKELVARSLHYCGPRAKEPFVAINCAAIPESLIEAELFGYQRGAFTGAVNSHAGAIESAHRGTLFLDEIGEMPFHMQPKLLRVLETSEVQRIGSAERKRINFRLVSATNRNLEDEVKQGRFREDLYYRIHVYPIHVPPLRDRPDDIPRLVTHHLSSIGIREKRPPLRMSPAALEQLIGYGWPGNVRELVNMLERAALLAGNRTIEPEHLVFPESRTERSGGSTLIPYRDAKARFELNYYAQLMRTAGGNVTLAAKLGQKTRKEIYDALKRCGLDVNGEEIAKSRRES